MTYSDGEAGAFLAGVLLLNFILGWVACYIGSVIERWKQEDMGCDYRLIKGQVCPPLNDEQKRKADSVRPVRSDSDIPQSIDGSKSIFFSGEIEVTRKNEKS